MRVFELMTKRVETLSTAATVSEAAQHMRRKRIRHIVVMEGDKVAGVVSDRDVRSPALLGERVTEVMGEPAIIVRPNETIRAAANRMRRNRVSSLTVVEGGRLVGILTVTDLLDLLGRGIDRASRSCTSTDRSIRQTGRSCARRSMSSSGTGPKRRGGGSGSCSDAAGPVS